MARDLDTLGDLDPDDPRQPSQQIANLLRAAILTSKFAPGEQLPSQPAISERYGVARETVKRALDVLTAERLVIRRQGSGTFVRAQVQRPVELRPHIEAAFERPHVTVDFAGASGETLRDAISEALDKVRAGRLRPLSISMRLLVNDTSAPMSLPTAVDPDDADRVRERAARILARAVDGLRDQVHELADLGLVPSAQVSVKTQRGGSPFKLYLINAGEAFFGFYPAVERKVTIGGEPVGIFDLLGKDVPLFHYAITDDEESQGTQFVTAAQQWFDSMWGTVAEDFSR